MRDLYRQAAEWLYSAAVPVWSGIGVDAKWGGFAESLSLDLVPTGLPKRCRSQARQIYSFAELGRLGWTGPYRELVAHGAAFLDKFRRPNGLYCYSVAPDGGPADESCPNYELAFALFGLAHAQKCLGAPQYEERALAILDRLTAERRCPTGGFFESANSQAPLLTNPHMHLFEAFLTWRALTGHPRWIAQSDAIGNLCLECMADRRTGAICEYYDPDWKPVLRDGTPVAEPGHQFEWAFLLLWWAKLSGCDVSAVVDRLYDLGIRFGVSPEYRIAMAEITPEGRVLDGRARLWSQAEWMRTALYQATRKDADRTRYENDARNAWNALARFLDTPKPGLWYDVFTADGAMVPEPARATSFYHIIGAVSALSDYINRDLTA